MEDKEQMGPVSNPEQSQSGKHLTTKAHPDAFKSIAAIVMPAGTGKSRFISKNTYSDIREADEVCATEETDSLAKFREYARRTNDWTPFDIEMAAELRSRLSSGDVILVSTRALARHLCAEVLGVFIMEESMWREQLEERGSDPVKHYAHYHDAANDPQSLVFDDHRILRLAIIGSVCLWRRSQ